MKVAEALLIVAMISVAIMGLLLAIESFPSWAELRMGW